MKKILLAISFAIPLFVLIAVCVVFGECLLSVSTLKAKPADIICWRGDSMEFIGFKLSVPVFESVYGAPLLTHTDIVIDEDGTLRTSIQNEGVSESTVESRQSQFNMGVLLRNPSLTEYQIESVLDTAYSLEGDYDWGGYNGQILDYLLRFPWMPEGRLFTTFLQSDDELYCSEYVALCFESNTIGVSAREASLTGPLDIYYYALDPDTGWEVMEVWEE